MYAFKNGFKSPYKSVVRSYIEGPRWAGLPGFFKQIEFTYPDIKVTVEVDKGWIRETVYFTLESDNVELLNRVTESINESLKEYNNGPVKERQ